MTSLRDDLIFGPSIVTLGNVMHGQRICLVCPLHVSFQPRTLREADWLHEIGCDVRVVSQQLDPVLRERDSRLLRTRKWRLDAVDLVNTTGNRWAWFKGSVRAKVSRRLFDAGFRHPSVAARGALKGFDRLIACACAEHADWFIAHTQAALPVAAAAARRWGTRLGFDCEDLLGEFDAPTAPLDAALERADLPLCDAIWAPSGCIADRLAERYGVPRPIVVYNVFPTSLATALSAPVERPERRKVRLHWFGQTIGSGRGLEDAVRALSLLGGDVELHLRGRLDDAYSASFKGLIHSSGVSDRVFFHACVDHDNLVGTFDQFDVGLALETPRDPNYARTATNKLFSYYLAGLAVAATDTPGQREVLSQAPEAGFLYPSGDAEALAGRLRAWLVDRNALKSAQQAAWAAARQRFCWEIEREARGGTGCRFSSWRENRG